MKIFYQICGVHYIQVGNGKVEYFAPLEFAEYYDRGSMEAEIWIKNDNEFETEQQAEEFIKEGKFSNLKYGTLTIVKKYNTH